MAFSNLGRTLEQLTDQISVDFSTAGDNLLINGANNAAVKIYRVSLTVFAATVLQFKGGPNPVSYTFTTPGSMVLDYAFAGMPPWYQSSIGSGFTINNSNAVRVSGEIDYAMIVGP